MVSGKKNANIWKYNSNTAFAEINLWIQQMYIPCIYKEWQGIIYMLGKL